MITIDQQEILGIPLLEIVEEGVKNKKLPTVFFYHGWTNYKESAIIHGYEIAKAGFRVIIPDAIYHGKRQDELETKAHFLEFWEIIYHTIEEFSLLTDYYCERELADRKRIGVTGLSMGGITTCGLMASYDWIKSADCLMGTPEFITFTTEIVENAVKEGLEIPEDFDDQMKQLAKIDLTLHPEKIQGRRFHFWHGVQDEVVPYQPTRDFYEKTKQLECGSNLSFTTTTDGHRVPYVISVETAEFFKETL